MQMLERCGTVGIYYPAQILIYIYFLFPSKNKTDYKELLQDLKKDKRRPIMAEETAEIESKIEKIKKAKVDFHLQNDELER